MSVDITHLLGSAAPTLSISLDAFCIDVNGIKALHSTDSDNPRGNSDDDEGSSDDSKEEDNSDNDEADPEFSKLIATLPEFMRQRLVSLHQSKANLHSIVMDSGRRPYACAPGLKSMFPCPRLQRVTDFRVPIAQSGESKRHYLAEETCTTEHLNKILDHVMAFDVGAFLSL